ncbi:MAG: DUF6427 family protein [Bacteroidota bacterium]
MLRILQSVQPFSYLLSLGTFVLMFGLLLFGQGGLEMFKIDYWWLSFGAVGLGLLWNRMVNSNEFKNREQTLTFWFWCLLGGLLVFLHRDWTWVVCNGLMAAMFFHLGPIHRQQDTKNQYFNAAFFGGLAVCLNFNYCWLLLGLLISLSYTRSGLWREWAWSFIGFLLPSMMKIVLFWLFSEDFDWFLEWMSTFQMVPKEWSFHWGFIPLLVLIGWGLMNFFGTYIESSIKGRNTRTVWVIMSLSYILCGVFESKFQFSSIAIWLLPFSSVLLGFCLNSQRVPWWKKALFWLFLSTYSLSVVGQIFN